MGAVQDEFQRDLAALSKRYAHDPRGEVLKLFLLSLEREQIVSVAYRSSLIAERLGRVSMSEDLALVVRHALLWAWKDEQMHAVYIRGLILSLGGRWLSMRALAHQVMGTTGGWASSIAQHVPWRVAPLSRLAAAAITGSGRLMGMVPRDVAPQLRLLPFAEFCRFNVDGELTARDCWARVAQLARTQPDFPPDVVESFDRIVADEERHRRVFEILARAVGDDDVALPGVGAEALTRELREVSEFFVPLRHRTVPCEPDPVGRGGTVAVTEELGCPVDKRAVLRAHLEAAGLPAVLAERTRALGRPPRVAVKPSFMLAYHRQDRSNFTDPELVDELARWLVERGVTDVAVVESPNLYSRFFSNRTVGQVAAYCGYDARSYRLVDLSADQVEHGYSRGMSVHTVSRTWRDAELRIAFGKLRSHPVHLVHLNVGNLDSISVPAESLLFLDRRADLDASVLMTLEDHPPHFALLDGFDSAAHGLAGVLGCPAPLSPRRLYGGVDTLAVDLVAARHTGLTRPEASPMLALALEWFGDPRPLTRVVGPDTPVPGWRHPHASGWWRLLSLLASPVYQLGSGRGSLFVPEMDAAAFPHRHPEGRALAVARAAVRRLLGLSRA